MGERKRPVLDFFTVVYEVMQKILTGVIWWAFFLFIILEIFLKKQVVYN